MQRNSGTDRTRVRAFDPFSTFSRPDQRTHDLQNLERLSHVTAGSAGMLIIDNKSFEALFTIDFNVIYKEKSRGLLNELAIFYNLYMHKSTFIII